MPDLRQEGRLANGLREPAQPEPWNALRGSPLPPSYLDIQRLRGIRGKRRRGLREVSVIRVYRASGFEARRNPIAGKRALLPRGVVAGTMPSWLVRPVRDQCGRRWPLVKRIYGELTDLELAEVMPPRERRHLDAVLVKRGRPPRILEVDETQHFNH
jgi:hypothetical protein